MNHGSLFSGIGGFDLAAEWAGWENKFHCEWNEFGQRVLKHYWPKAISYDDIKKTDFTIWRGRIDVLTGGFPCQPYSSAGKRKGKEDERHLWPEMLRAIREIQPRWIVGENVLGLVNWNGGLVFEEVQADLESEGYEVQPFILPAASVNAPHRRDRVWFVAYSDGASKRNNKGANGRTSKEVWRQKESNVLTELRSNGTTSDPDNGLNFNEEKQLRTRRKAFISSGNGNATDPNSRRFTSKEHRETESRQHSKDSLREWFKDFPTQSPLCGRDDGLPTKLDGITFPKWRNESIKAYGNAVVPQVVYQIFQAINKFEELKSKSDE